MRNRWKILSLFLIISIVLNLFSTVGYAEGSNCSDVTIQVTNYYIDSNKFIIELVDGTFRAGSITKEDFIFDSEWENMFKEGVFTRTSDAVVTISNLKMQGSVYV